MNLEHLWIPRKDKIAKMADGHVPEPILPFAQMIKLYYIEQKFLQQFFLY